MTSLKPIWVATPLEEAGPPSGTPYISFYCDDLEETVGELQGRGVEFTDNVSDVGWGRTIHFKMPGGFQVQLYQTNYRK